MMGPQLKKAHYVLYLKMVVVLMLAGTVSGVGVFALKDMGSWSFLYAGAVGVVATIVGIALGAAKKARESQLKFYHVADELAQYRSFTSLLRTQGERIIDLSEEAAAVVMTGLRQMDNQIGAMQINLAAFEKEVKDAQVHIDALRDRLYLINAPTVEMLGVLQFQDVTRQQYEFLARLSLLLDEHMEELSRGLGDRRSLDRTTRFKELFDRALNESVMTSQRNDHREASGIEMFEPSGPSVELFDEIAETK